MGGFCRYCGRELDGNEPYCPECGMPTGSGQPQTYHSPSSKKRDVGIAIAAIAVIAALCMVGIAMLPMFIDVNEDRYDITLTVTSFRIDVVDKEHQYNGPLTSGEASLSITCSNGSKSLNKTLVLDRNYPINTDSTSIQEDKYVVEMTGDPKDLKFMAFLHYKVSRPGVEPITDIIDLYSVEPRPADVRYVGGTGVIFDIADLSNDGIVTLKGDSDPIGTVVLKIATVKK